MPTRRTCTCFWRRSAAERAAARGEIETARKQADAFKGQLSAEGEKLAQVQRDADRAHQSELEEARAQIQRLTSELERLRQESERLRAEADQVVEERAQRRAAEDRRVALEERVESLERDLAKVSGTGAVSSETSEQLMTLHDCVAALRASMRAASDETAVMSDNSPSVQVIVDALSDATEQIERARDCVRELEQALGTD